MKKTAILALVAGVCAVAGAFEVDNSDRDVAERYIQCYNGEIQLLPALTKEEIPWGHVEGVEAVGGFVFDIDWSENKVTRMRVRSKDGGVCRIRSYGGMGSPILRKAKKDCANPAIAATKNLEKRPTTPESVFDRKKTPLPSVSFDFDTEPGEILELRGVSGNQDWTDYSKTLSDKFLRSAEGARIMRNVLDWQLATGGWPKNVPMHNKLTERERKAVLARKGDKITGTIDNAATFAEMNFLARFYHANVDSPQAAGSRFPLANEALAGLVRGIDFLLYMQYPNGGWPQCDPAKVGYWHQITFNDGAMVNVMETLRNVYEARPPYDLPIPEAKRKACRAAFDKGLECILKTQIRQDGKLTVWCQQHDRDTLEPCIGRAFELPALTSYESRGILRLLMSLDLDEYPPDVQHRVTEAIVGAAAWYAKTGIQGYAIEDNFRRDDGILTKRLVRVPPEESKTLWARYYTLEDNRPFTGTRQSEKRFTFEDLERGENMTYQWFNTTGTDVKREYEKWLKNGAGHKGGKPGSGGHDKGGKHKPDARHGRDSHATKTAQHVPPPKPTVIRVAPKGGDFATVQAAIDSIEPGSSAPYVIKLAPGRYREKVTIAGDRSNIRIVAQDPNPAKTVISWNDTPATIGPNGKALGTFGSYTMSVGVDDFELEGVTVENTGTPERLAATLGKEQAGQCVALFVKGDRCAFRKCRILGWQDTLYAGGSVGFSPARQYFEDCFIEGAVDFIFGGAVALFNHCELRTVNGGFVTAGNHEQDLPFGYVFYKCRITAAPGKQTYLGRPWRPFANITFVQCDYTNAVCPQGWHDWTTACGVKAWRSAEYACTEGRPPKPVKSRPDPIVKVGTMQDFQKRLAAAGLKNGFDIIAGTDGWHPMHRKQIR